MLAIQYVYEQKVVPDQVARGKHKFKLIPDGAGHMVEPVALETTGKALCGADVTRFRHRVIREKFLEQLAICPACSAAWKKHPQSPWAKWVGVA